MFQMTEFRIRKRVMKTITNKTNSVKMMREIRDKISIEIMDMTLEQEREYIKNQLAGLKFEKNNRKNIIKDI